MNINSIQVQNVAKNALADMCILCEYTFLLLYAYNVLFIVLPVSWKCFFYINSFVKMHGFYY
jgi:hypothetical protein